MAKRTDLIELVEALRADLERLNNEAAAKELVFEVGSVELELQVAVKVSGEATAQAKFWVLDLGSAKGSLARESAHKIKLTLRPRAGGSATRGTTATPGGTPQAAVIEIGTDAPPPDVL